MLLLGAIGLHCCISGVVMVKPKPSKLPNGIKTDASHVTVDNKTAENDTNTNDCKTIVVTLGPKTKNKQILLNVLENDVDAKTDYESDENCTEVVHIASNDVEKPIIVINKNNNKVESDTRTASLIVNTLKRFRTVLGSSILNDKAFVLFAFSQGFISLSQKTTHMFLPALAAELGYSDYQAAALLVIIGVSDTISRLLIGAFLGCKCLKPLLFTCWVLMIASFCIGISLQPFAFHYAMTAVTCSMIGIGFGSIVCQRPVIACELLGIEKLDNTVAFSVAIQGSMVLVGPAIGG